MAVGKFADAPLPPSPPKPMDAIRLRAALFMSPDSEEEEGGGELEEDDPPLNGLKSVAAPDTPACLP